MKGSGWNLSNAPGKMIALLIGLVVIGSIAGATWSLILTQFGAVGALANFTFASLIGGSSTSLTVILLSVAIVAAILGALGYGVVQSKR